MAIDQIKFDEVRQRAESEYKAMGKVKCPYLNDFVYFNAEGFKPILFKGWNIARSREDRYVRLCLISLALKVLSRSHTLQEYFECRRFERVQSNSIWKEEIKLVKYYGFVAVINSALIKPASQTNYLFLLTPR